MTSEPTTPEPDIRPAIPGPRGYTALFAEYATDKFGFPNGAGEGDLHTAEDGTTWIRGETAWQRTRAHTLPEMMRVHVRDHAEEKRMWGRGYAGPIVRTVSIPAVCPQCGGPRGEVKGNNSSEDGEYYHVSIWDNPCGHVDMYDNVIIEAARWRDCCNGHHSWGEHGTGPCTVCGMPTAEPVAPNDDTDTDSDSDSDIREYTLSRYIEVRDKLAASGMLADASAADFRAAAETSDAGPDTRARVTEILARHRYSDDVRPLSQKEPTWADVDQATRDGYAEDMAPVVDELAAERLLADLDAILDLLAAAGMLVNTCDDQPVRAAARDAVTSGLNATALETLEAAGVSAAQWRRHHGMADTWRGDACGCTDDRCIGFHHYGPDDCGCLPVLLAEMYNGSGL